MEFIREAVGDRRRLQPIRRAELAQDVRDVDAGGPDADDECLRDLAVGVAAGDESEDLRLARGEAEDVLQARLSVGRRGVQRCEIEPRALGEQLELAKEGLRSDPRRDGMRRRERALASARDAPAATSASAWRQWQ